MCACAGRTVPYRQKRFFNAEHLRLFKTSMTDYVQIVLNVNN